VSHWDLSFAAHTRDGGPAGYGWCLCRTGERDGLSIGGGIVPPPFGADSAAAAWVAAGKALTVLADWLSAVEPEGWPGAFVRSHHEAVIRGLKAAVIGGSHGRLHARCLDVLLTRVAPWGAVAFEVVGEGCNSAALGEARRAVEGSVAA
jgi:hypothetical protein